ncbi:MAG: rod shape-determining protein RodA [Thermoanaerobaculia bacterium]
MALAEERRSLRRFGRVRWGLLVAALLLAAIGLVTVHSASSELQVDYLPRQAAWVGLGLIAFLLAFSVDYQSLAKFSLLLYAGSVAALVAVLFLGYRSGGAQSWFAIGGVQIQPAEFAKLATALMLARYLGGLNRDRLSVGEIAVAGLITAVPMGLIVLERDLGGAAMFLPLLAGALLVAGVPWRLVAAAVVIAVAIGVVAWNFFLLDYQRDRVLTFLDPEREPQGAGYQLRQSKIAVGSGQFAGRGYMQGTQSQLRFLPARHTDFIFAVLAEEWGFVGVVSVFVLYGLYVSNGARVAVRARDRTGVLLVVSLLSLVSFHVLYNTAMVVGLMPITGIPLPFLSYGGSFTLANFAAAGLILNVDFRRHVNR